MLEWMKNQYKHDSFADFFYNILWRLVLFYEVPSQFFSLILSQRWYDFLNYGV